MILNFYLFLTYKNPFVFLLKSWNIFASSSDIFSSLNICCHRIIFIFLDIFFLFLVFWSLLLEFYFLYFIFRCNSLVFLVANFLSWATKNSRLNVFAFGFSLFVDSFLSEAIFVFPVPGFWVLVFCFYFYGRLPLFLWN